MKVTSGLQRPGSGHRGGRSAPHRHSAYTRWAEETIDGHDTAIKGAVTDGMKRAFRSFGLQFGNGFYGDQPQAGSTAQAGARARPGPGQRQRSGQGPGQRAALSPSQRRCASGSSRSPASRGSTRNRCGTAVLNRTGKGIDDLTAAELGPLVEAAANKLREMQQAQAA